MDPLLKGYFDKFITASELRRPKGVAIDDASKMSSLYERFINYTLFSFDEPEAFTANTELLDFVSPGGDTDAKIDGFGIIVQGRLISSKEDILQIINTVRKVNIEFVAIQTKMRPKFSSTEFLAFGTLLRKFFSSSPPPINTKLREMYDLKNFIFEDHRILQALQSNPILKIYYVNIGQFKPDEHYLSAKKSIEASFQDDSYKGDFFDGIEIKVIDAKGTREMVESLENYYDVCLNIKKSMTLTVGDNENIKKAVSFTCTAEEFLKLLTRKDGTLRRSLFNDNVRDYLGTGNVNREIETTMLDEPELFLLCNNGITIVSSNFEPIKDDLVRIVNPQIVNGCQTSNTLYKLRDKIDKSRLLLSIRIICTDDTEISNKVVRSTNRQNQVLEEAFEATKPYHQNLEKMFAFTADPVKLYYERRTRQYALDSLIPKAHIVNLRVLTHVFVAAILGYPHEAHRHEAKLLEQYGREHRRIFCEDHPLDIYYLCALLYYRVEEAFKSDNNLKRFAKYRGHLYFIIRKLVASNVPKLADTNKDYNQFVKRFSEYLSDPDTFHTHISEASCILDRTQKLWISAGKSRFGIKDSPDFTKLLIEEISKIRTSTKNDIQLHDPDPNINKRFCGTILFYNSRISGKWYAYIRPDNGSENIYFDSRYFKGETRNIIPGTKVEYSIAVDDEGKLHGENVIIK